MTPTRLSPKALLIFTLTVAAAAFSAALDKFLDNIRLPEGYEKPETPYYDLWIGGLHFIFLGDTDLPSEDVKATIGNEQYAWLS